MRLLLIEDDVMIGTGVRAALRQDGYVDDWVQDGAAAEAALAAEPAYALVLLDLGLPKKDGLALLESLRRRGKRIPVLIITARDAVADRVRGLDLGADDYLVKPFELDELGARIRALLRRHAGRAEPVVEFGGFRLDPSTRKVSYLGREVSVSAREFSLL
ncbi:MAG: response regulator, partial [Betaproteobacteria bacterium]